MNTVVEALRSSIAWAAWRSSSAGTLGGGGIGGLSSREYGRYMSFFLGGSDSAAPVLVKHMANDFLPLGGGAGEMLYSVLRS